MKPFKTAITLMELGKPQGWDEEKQGKCETLHVHKYDDGFLSYWKPTFFERVRILFGANLRLAIIGNGHPPVWIDVDPNSFKEIT